MDDKSCLSPLHLQGWTIRPYPGLMNIVPVVAYHFCLNIPAAFSQPRNGLIVQPLPFIWSFNSNCSIWQPCQPTFHQLPWDPGLRRDGSAGGGPADALLHQALHAEPRHPATLHLRAQQVRFERHLSPLLLSAIKRLCRVTHQVYSIYSIQADPSAWLRKVLASHLHCILQWLKESSPSLVGHLAISQIPNQADVPDCTDKMLIIYTPTWWITLYWVSRENWTLKVE